jgi:glucose/arabinose dehydrogenase
MQCKKPNSSIALSAFAAAVMCFSASSAIASDEIDGLTLPSGFHASLVVDGVAGARHLAFRRNGDLFVSTRGENASGVIAIHLGEDHKADRIERFTKLGGGTGIRFSGDALYASSPTAIYRFVFHRGEFVPVEAPETIVQGMPDKGFSARPISFDDRGTLYVGVGGSANICAEPNAPKGSKPVGLNPCPDLEGRAGIWRFDSRRANQSFPSDGKHIATGLRDVGAIDWRTSDGLYAVMHNRNGTHATWPELISASDELAVAEEMHRIVPGSNLGWPYTYFDGVRNLRLMAPEYGGDGKLTAPDGKYSVPVLAFLAIALLLIWSFIRVHSFRVHTGVARLSYSMAGWAPMSRKVTAVMTCNLSHSLPPAVPAVRLYLLAALQDLNSPTRMPAALSTALSVPLWGQTAHFILLTPRRGAFGESITLAQISGS